MPGDRGASGLMKVALSVNLAFLAVLCNSRDVAPTAARLLRCWRRWRTATIRALPSPSTAKSCSTRFSAASRRCCDARESLIPSSKSRSDSSSGSSPRSRLCTISASRLIAVSKGGGSKGGALPGAAASGAGGTGMRWLMAKKESTRASAAQVAGAPRRGERRRRERIHHRRTRSAARGRRSAPRWPSRRRAALPFRPA